MFLVLLVHNVPSHMRRYFCAYMRKKPLRAFSTGEVLLAMFIMTSGLVTIVAVLSGSLRNSLSIRDVIIASELAQEGVELVRNVRDNDFASGGNGFSSSTGFENSKKHCRIDYDASKINCSSSQGSVGTYSLNYSGGMYHYDASGSMGRFSRYIWIDYDATGPHATVRSFVVWGGGNLPPASGSSANCTAANKCAFTEAFLTSWE